MAKIFDFLFPLSALLAVGELLSDARIPTFVYVSFICLKYLLFFLIPVTQQLLQLEIMEFLSECMVMNLEKQVEWLLVPGEEL